MKRFVKLSFPADENLFGRAYWYLSDFPVSLGEKVLAPIGLHNKLQLACVEEVVEGESPLEERALKRLAAKYGARKLIADGATYLEFGGARYDGKHYTPFCKLLLTEERPESMGELLTYAPIALVEGDARKASYYEKILRSENCVLLYGESGRTGFFNLLELMRGREDPLKEIALKRATIAGLKEKFQ